MTIEELINEVKEEKPNSFTNDKLTKYINEIEAQVQMKKDKDVYLAPYVYADDKATELLVPAPFNHLYKSYLKAQIDYANEEYASYQNNQQQFVTDWNEFVDWLVQNGLIEGSNAFRFKNVV